MSTTSSAMEVQDLHKRFPPDVEAVKGLSFTIVPGEVFGLLGPNGAGKTTTMRMMMGMVSPTSGAVQVFGEEIRGWRQDVKARMGICPQEPVLWDDLTCAEHLELVGAMYEVPAATVKERAARLLADLQLTEKSRALARTLSGGMKRRLNLALALIHDPDIVILDEPTAGLDPQSRALLWDYIRSLARADGKTVVLTTHFMDEADNLSDRIAVVDGGTLLVLDTPQALKASIGEGDMLDVALDHPLTEAALDTLRSLPGVKAANMVDTRLTVQALDVTAKLQHIFRVLAESGVTASDIRLRTNTLEDVFLQLTGRSLREEGQ